MRLNAYLINLDRSGDRLAHMQAELDRAGVAFERVVGVDGSALAASALAAFQRARTAAKPGGWLPGEVGCFLSHFALWQRIAAGSEEWAAILEDDVRVAPDLGRLLRSSDWIPPAADIIRIEASGTMRLAGGAPVAPAPGRRIFRALSGTAGTAGYIIARRAAAWLIETSPALHTSADVFLFKPKMSSVARKLQRYQIVPALCVQDGVMEGGDARLKSLIKTRTTRGRGYRERSNPLLKLWPLQRHAVPFRP